MKAWPNYRISAMIEFARRRTCAAKNHLLPEGRDLGAG
jgi:hypothetical protein